MMSDFDLSGIRLIGEMSKDDIIEELTTAWRKDLSKKDITELKQMIIAVRIQRIQDRMIEEAGLVKHTGFLGTHFHEKDEENED